MPNSEPRDVHFLAAWSLDYGKLAVYELVNGRLQFDHWCDQEPPEGSIVKALEMQRVLEAVNV